MLSALALSLALCAGPKVDPRLVGTWTFGGAFWGTLKADGTGSGQAGKVTWTADGLVLFITDAQGTRSRLPYKVNGAVLEMSYEGFPMVLMRGAPPGKEPAPAQGQPAARGAAPAGAPKPAGGDQLSRLLLSSAWCTFHYNKVSGTSSSSRYAFFANGTWSTGGRTETYNSGANGSVAGQYDSTNGGRWEVRNGQLWMSNPQNPQLQPVGAFTVTRNSNGAPIINANGEEFSSCN